jgi:tetratricopeptide (TPR) repeat protein
VRHSRLREALLAALDDWWRVTKDAAEGQRLEVLLQAAEPAPDAFRVRWRSMLRRGDGEALVRLAGEPGAEKRPPEAVVSLARDLAKLKQYAAAERLLRAAQQRYRNNFWLNHNLGIALLKQPSPRPVEAARYLTAALALRSDNPGVCVNLGIALLDSEDVDGAIREFQTALRINPNYVAAHHNLGLALHRRKDLKGAIRAFRAALQIDPRCADVHCNLGHALGASNDLEGAIRHYRAALEIEKSAAAHCGLGLALHTSKDPEGAIREYRAALKIRPRFALAHYNLGIALLEKRDHDAAIAAFQKAAELRPDHAWSHAYLGDVLQAADRPDEAMKAYTKAVQLRRKLVADFPRVAAYRSQLGASLNNLAFLLLKRESPASAVPLLEEAVRHQKAALKLGPEAPYYRPFLRNHYENLAEALIQLGQHGKAATAAAELPDLYPDRPQEAVRAAGFLARCAGLAARDTTLPEARRKELVDAHGHRAVALLRRAMDRGWNDRTALDAAVFKPLRSRDDFQKLLAALGMKSEP